MPDRAQYKNFYLLLLLLSYFIANACLAETNINGYFATVSMAFTILVCGNMIERSKFIACIITPFGLLAILGFVLVATLKPSNNLYVAHFTVNGIFMVAITFFQLKSCAQRSEITVNTLLGAICAYLMIGLTWTYFDLALAHAIPGAFYPEPATETFRHNLDYYTYFSFCTLTTLGFGDIIPKSSLARTFTWAEAVIGQIYLAVWISQLVAIHTVQIFQRKE